MIIKELSCERFAGIRDTTLTLQPGMNLLLGENESGKSTLADLLYQLFFQDTKLDGRRDKVFLDTYFPKGVDRDGDIIDGKVRFQTEAGSHTLYKEWSPGGSLCRLTTPEGTRLSSPEAIRTVLEDALLYGKGIYDEVVFAGQKRPQTLLTALLDSKKDKKAAPAEVLMDLSATLQAAVLETGGVSLDRLDARLSEILTGFTGHWDLEADRPEKGRMRGIENPWKTGCGSILERYYAMERAAKRRKDTEDVEKRLEHLSAQLRTVKDRRKEVAALQERFSAFQGDLQQRENLKSLRQSLDAQLREMLSAEALWPQAEQQHRSAQELSLALERSELLRLYRSARELREKLRTQEQALEALGPVEESDVTLAQTLSTDIARLEATIRGLNLAAKLTLLGDTPVSVQSAVTGEALDTEGGSFAITEAVEITAPGVLRLQLMPRGVDLTQTREALAAKGQQLKALLERYDAQSPAELSRRRDQARRLTGEIQLLRTQLTRELGSWQLEALEAAARELGEMPRTPEELRRDIRLLCGNVSADAFAGRQAGIIQGFRNKYGTQTQLAEAIETAKQQLAEYDLRLGAVREIPEEFRSVTDPELWLSRTREDLAELDEAAEALHRELRETQLPPDAPSAEECAEEYRKLQEQFQEEKLRYRRWAHIREVFLRLRQQELGDPTQDIQISFRRNLALLSDDTIRMEDMDEKLRPSLVSGSSRLSYNILSEGTKDTVSLAFRLAMLEHLYPQGGAVAIFDDPFTDMDPRRREQACRLLQAFAEKNQVLFFTCDSIYGELLTGNRIDLQRNI